MTHRRKKHKSKVQKVCPPVMLLSPRGASLACRRRSLNRSLSNFNSGGDWEAGTQNVSKFFKFRYVVRPRHSGSAKSRTCPHLHEQVRAENKHIQSHGMDRKEVTMSQMTLPEALVEKIIAMMPYPSIFKARCLSKSWLARFSSISSLDVEEKGLATSFQKEVSKWSRNWDTFYPVVIDVKLKVFLTYKQGSQKWSRIPSLSFLPFHGNVPNWLLESRGVFRHWQIEGPLLYGPGHQDFWTRSGHVFVANLMTRSWRQLPPRPHALVTSVYYNKVVIHPSSETYKVILVIKFDGDEHYCAQIFDSKVDAWSSGKKFEASTDFRDKVVNAAHVDGVLYMVAERTPQILLAVNLEEGTVEEITLSVDNDDVLRHTTVTLVVCNVDWLMLVTGYETNADAVQVFKIELEDGRLVPLAMFSREGPINLSIQQLRPAGDGNRILFWKHDWRTRREGKGKCFSVVAYNVDDNVWSSFDAPEEAKSELNFRCFGWSFRPGLSPFLVV